MKKIAFLFLLISSCTEVTHRYSPGDVVYHKLAVGQEMLVLDTFTQNGISMYTLQYVDEESHRDTLTASEIEIR